MFVVGLERNVVQNFQGMIGIFNEGRELRDKRFENAIRKIRNVFSGVGAGRNDRSSRMIVLVYFWEQIEG